MVRELLLDMLRDMLRELLLDMLRDILRELLRDILLDIDLVLPRPGLGRQASFPANTKGILSVSFIFMSPDLLTSISWT